MGRARLGSISGIVGVRKASMTRQSPGMDLPGLFRRGVANMRIQASLTAAAINLKQQGVALLASLVRWLGVHHGQRLATVRLTPNLQTHKTTRRPLLQRAHPVSLPLLLHIGCGEARSLLAVRFYKLRQSRWLELRFALLTMRRGFNRFCPKFPDLLS